MMNFDVDDRVRRIKEDRDRIGTIVEIDAIAKKYRILWDAVAPAPGTTASNYHASKRTWLGFKAIEKA